MASTLRVFTKLMKVSIAILTKLNILLILYLDNILLIVRSQKKLIAARGCSLALAAPRKRPGYADMIHKRI